MGRIRHVRARENPLLSATYATVGALRPTARAVGAPTTTMISALQSGHGWTADGTGTSNLNDTSDYVLGSQAASGTSDGGGSNYQRLSKYGLAVDMTGKQFKLWVKEGTGSIKDILVYARSGASWTHFYMWSIRTTASTAPYLRDGWRLVTLNFGDAAVTGTPDRAAIEGVRVAWRDNGGASTATVHVNGLASFAEPATAFPNGVVSLTFDDGYSSIFTEARKKMDTYGFPGTHYTIRDLIGTSGYMTTAQLAQLQDLHGWEIGSHADTNAAHTDRFTGLTTAELEVELRDLKAWMTGEGFRAADQLAYPGGEFNEAVTQAMTAYYASGRTTSGKGLTLETVPPADPYRLRAFNVIDTDTTGTIQALVDKAYTNKQWLILVFHKILTTSATSIEYSIANFGTVVDYLNTKGIPVRTVGEVLRAT